MQLPKFTGSFRLFNVFRIPVFLHWSWFVVAVLMIEMRWRRGTSTLLQAALEYVSLFGLVLVHELGHALASRSVGGHSDRIMLWPLGGIAFVRTPPVPWKVLWSIAAGPLVNVALFPLTLAVYLALRPGDQQADSMLASLAFVVMLMNMALLCFNMMPVYPLDGGQILRALLWFAIGPVRSLHVAANVGIVGAVAGILLAFRINDLFLALIAIFLCWQAFLGRRMARMMAQINRSV